ncbi:Mut7-C ubiquitin/RNAse domain-containing protein [bacterium]|nr:Mut7-C ubiquitin/RNAse domain-containing protein [bacterium]
MTSISIHFYGNLNDFLPAVRRRKQIVTQVNGQPAVKDTIEALGVPHTEVDVILVNNQSVDFTYQLHSKDKVKVYPKRIELPASQHKHLYPKIPRFPKFVLDCHLGKLARYLRLLGFDTVYKKHFPDENVVEIGVQEKRIILTRDRGILKHKTVKLGYCLRSTVSLSQVQEIMDHYNLRTRIRPFCRCLECNGRVLRVAKKTIEAQLPPKTKEYYQNFYQCRDCKRIYWQGSHYGKLLKLVNRFKKNK